MMERTTRAMLNRDHDPLALARHFFLWGFEALLWGAPIEECYQELAALDLLCHGYEHLRTR